MYLYESMGCCGTLARYSHPDHNKGPDPGTFRMSKDLSHRSLILAILQSRQLTLLLQDLCLVVLTVHSRNTEKNASFIEKTKQSHGDGKKIYHFFYFLKKYETLSKRCI